MSESGPPSGPEAPPSHESRTTVPNGYRCAVVTAITVVLGFSFLFLRSWAFELPGEWTISSGIAAVLLLSAIVLELLALWRALQLKDDRVQEYERTLRWFLGSLVVLLVSLVLSALSYSHNA
jgi:4-amino-4-deoxy-L-arabinose transferase-like glycosyltransferase